MIQLLALIYRIRSLISDQDPPIAEMLSFKIMDILSKALQMQGEDSLLFYIKVIFDY
jgi:hypothetical protein